jgi:uncharacterized SAM-binding protein YcdF (DUF218 family)
MALSLFFRRLLIIIMIPIALWIIGFNIFIFTTKWQVQEEQTVTQAVVVLTGGRERLKTGFQILCSKRSEMIFISGVHPGETFKSLLKTVELPDVLCPNREALATVTHLGYTAKNTKENAQESAQWVKKNSITSLRLVTSAYHMPRSLLEFRQLLPYITIVPHPVYPNGYDRFPWWRKGVFRLMFLEYNKFLLTFARIHMPFASTE